MMREAKNIILSLMCFIMFGALVSCSEDDEPTPTLRPTLSATELAIEMGDSARLQVLNADSINFVSTNNSQVLSLRIEGTDVIVYALAEGEAKININVNGARLYCDVVVNKNATPQIDFSKELQDVRTRFVSPSLSLFYETPGTIVSVAEGNMIEMRSLITSDNIIFNLGEVALKEGTLPNATLQINGNSVELKQATLERLSPDGSMWINILDTNGNRMVLVVTDM